MATPLSELELLRATIANAAARLIAADGADYGSAKRKAARQILGERPARAEVLPDNAQIEEAVREYNALFLRATQPQRLLHLRRLAWQMMEELQEFSPYLTGAVLNGTAGAHTDIHLHLFADNPKEVEIHLLNKNIRFEATAAPSPNRSDPLEILRLSWRDEDFHLSLYPYNELRRAPKKRHSARAERANSAEVAALIQESIDQ